MFRIKQRWILMSLKSQICSLISNQSEINRLYIKLRMNHIFIVSKLHIIINNNIILSYKPVNHSQQQIHTLLITSIGEHTSLSNTFNTHNIMHWLWDKVLFILNCSKILMKNQQSWTIIVNMVCKFQTNCVMIYLPDLKIQRSWLHRSPVQHSWQVVFSCLFDSKRISLPTKSEPWEVGPSTHNCKYEYYICIHC